jgi:formylglycine-generating enzyme required for sulfatase activity
MATPWRGMIVAATLVSWFLTGLGWNEFSLAQVATPDPREGMLLVPAGEFIQGSSEEDTQADKDEMPQRVVFLDAYYIDQFEVTNIEYKRFIDATGYPAPPSWVEGFYADGADFYPIVEVSWWDAVAYARWHGKRLPTEAEWEKAARGTDGRRYPWGNEYDSHLANDERLFQPVNAHLDGASPYGAVNMAGNAAEWTASVYEPYPELVAVLPEEFGGAQPSSTVARPRIERLTPRPERQPEVQRLEPKEPTGGDDEAALDEEEVPQDPRAAFFTPEELQDTQPRVYRGGSINNYPRFLRCANREKESPGARWYNLGFRCAMDAKSGAAPPSPRER